ncbi:VOC family protein [Rhodobiaceae bacterium]|nr:VOC family protein [Rhodobiaceae bacterium]
MFQSKRPIIQIAYAVDNIVNSAEIWSKKFNIGPFYINEHIKISNTLVNNKKAEFDHSSAYGWKENMMIELICDHKIEESPMSSNRSGIHHIAWIAPNFEEERKLLKDEGCIEVLSANSGHRNGMKFAWFDPKNEMNHFYEIYEDTDDIKNFYSFLYQESKNWDGLNPVRNVSDI